MLEWQRFLVPLVWSPVRKHRLSFKAFLTGGSPLSSKLLPATYRQRHSKTLSSLSFRLLIAMYQKALTLRP